MALPLDRREVILREAAELFARQGVAATTVREIADAAGILSGSLYHHFDSKESMVEALLRDFLDQVGREYVTVVSRDTDPVSTLRALVHDAFESLGANPAALAVMINEFNFLVQFPRFAYLREGAEETERLWSGVIEDGMRTGDIRSDIEPRMIYRFMRDTIWISVRWYHPEGRYQPDQIADFYIDVLLDGITTGPRARTLGEP